MANRISALECIPSELIREVSLEAVELYVEGLSGLYLPDSTRQEHLDSSDIRNWKPEDRLRCKFARFAISRSAEKLKDVLLMGSTVKVGRVDQHGGLDILRHYEFQGKLLRNILEKRGDADHDVAVRSVDYGNVRIELGPDEQAKKVVVSGRSIDYGSADTDGRKETCELFQDLLGTTILVENEPL